MGMRLALAALHLLALGIGLGAVYARGRSLRATLDASGLRRIFHADGLWGVAALLWIGTGLARVLAGTEKAPEFYWHNHLFWTKMALLAAVLLLEIRPAIVLVRWRISARRGEPVDTTPAPALARTSFLQCGLIILMVIVAVTMARGYGAT